MAFAPTVLGDIYVEDQGNANEPVVLLWPSLFTDHTMWRNQIPALRAAGWRTLALDPPGHAKSKGVARHFTMDECADAALQVLDAMNVRTPVVVLGTSWGGMIAPRLALRAPDRIRGLVLTNTTADSAKLYDRLKCRLLAVMLAYSFLDGFVNEMVCNLQLAPVTRRRHPELKTELSSNFRSWDRHGLINSVRAVLVERDASLNSLSQAKAPTLILSGKEDTILPSYYSRRIEEEMPRARHVQVPDAAHLVPLEAPDTCNTLILEFIADLKGGHRE